MARTLAWFSCGAPSAVMTRLLIAESPPDLVVAYVDTGSEHEDNERFLAECEAWFGRPVTRLKSEKYRDTWQVWKERRFLVGPQGALCTTELKKKVRLGFERPDDTQCFGYTADPRDAARGVRFREQNPGVEFRTPLIEHGLTKADCLALVERAGIELPMMYRLGYDHANCVGCPKGGMGYWNRIRRDFPETFDRMAQQERELGATVLRDNGAPLYLDELDPERGDFSTEPDIDCSLMCVLAEDAIAEAKP